MAHIWKHKKTGGEYHLIFEDATLEVDLTPVVVYMSQKDNRVWVRPSAEFHDGRFEKVEI